MREGPHPGSGDADEVEQFGGAFAGPLPGHALMGPYGLRDLVADAVDRCERGERVLEDHGDAAPPDPGQLPFARADQFLPVEPYGPLDGRVVGQQPEDGERGGRLPGPRLTDQAEDFAPREREAHVADGGPPVEVHVQTGHFEHGSHRDAPFLLREVGSSASRSPSPTRFTASTKTTSSPAA
ncbi:hypothetical protein SAV31267_064400 [Streptomyces avermitilis]|uniref:Uncharacterized protein n=1 Tax=Streptomyces avermitilis TaxID=33903 RepID=A0A4D4MZW0_STRAX|nr:hypothetical protein SAV31267_064400 [Streptomyces avermitilis]